MFCVPVDLTKARWKEPQPVGISCMMCILVGISCMMCIVGTCMMQESSQGLIFVFLSQEAPAPDPHFFERLEKEVLKEIKKERQQAEFEAAPESARVAQLANELEKRDSLIKKLHVENELLVVCICVGCLCVCVCVRVRACWGQFRHRV